MHVPQSLLAQRKVLHDGNRTDRKALAACKRDVPCRHVSNDVRLQRLDLSELETRRNITVHSK